MQDLVYELNPSIPRKTNITSSSEFLSPKAQPKEQREQSQATLGLCRVVTEEDEIKTKTASPKDYTLSNQRRSPRIKECQKNIACKAIL